MEGQAVDQNTEKKNSVSSEKNNIFENILNTVHSEMAAVAVEAKSKVEAAATATTTIASNRSIIKDKEEKIDVDDDGTLAVSSIPKMTTTSREITVTARGATAPVVSSGSPGQTN